MRTPTITILLSLMIVGTCVAQSPNSVDSSIFPGWDTSKLFQTPTTYPAPEFEREGVQGLFFDGLDYQRKPTRVFAWVGFPNVPDGTKVPGIVLVHGGGGTAFENWVRLWTSRGYAAIAMDNCGGIPISNGNRGWERHDHSSPNGWGGWDNIDENYQDHWTYHAVADVILAHSLLRSFPQVDPERTGITGVSWGGYLTCISASVDSRFKFAAPVYGCGFTNENGFAEHLARTGEQKSKRWMQWWDPSVYLPRAKMPFLWVNGTNDAFYTFNAMQKSYRLPESDHSLSIRVRMGHAHGPVSEAPEEIHVFANSVVSQASPLPKILNQGRQADHVWISFETPPDVTITNAKLNVTTQRGRWQDRHWDEHSAVVEGNKISAKLPENATVYFINLIDSRNCIVSSDHVEINAE